MRIAGGIYRGRLLKTVPGYIARPTTDKIRQAIFNILMKDIEDKTVLDLFAGSGALGIEALSRGAKAATFVEISHKAAVVIRQNLAALELYQTVLEMDYKKGCRQLSEYGARFGLIFADAPYDRVAPGEVAEAVLQYSLLAPEGFLIIEHRAGAGGDLKGLICVKARQFGQTEVTFYAPEKKE